MLGQAIIVALSVLSCTASALQGRTILQNGQVKITNYPNTAIDKASHSFHSYPANASQLSYKGRWDSRKISWWS